MSTDIATWVASTASAVDANESSATQILSHLAELGLLDLDIDAVVASTSRDVTASAELIAEVAEECVSQAFSLWAHRMVLEYVARGQLSARSHALLSDLRAGRRVGSTAMAAGLKSLAGISSLEISAERTPGGWSLTGRIPWASNLVEGGVFVLPAQTEDGTALVAWADTDAPGVTIRPATGLLALDATASGFVQLEGVQISDDQVLSHDLTSFARGFRPTFLVLQTAFCAGLIRRSLQEAQALLERGENRAFTEDVQQVGDEVTRFLASWRALAADITQADPVPFLKLRLEATGLAGRITRLEATLAGGRGYQTRTGASRRFREAAFLPVQSPSEGQLRWELASLAN